MATQTNARKWTIAQTRRAFLAVAMTALFCLPAAAGWRDAASPYDIGRLEKLDESRAKGLSEAEAGRDAGLVHAVLGAAQRPVSGGALKGAWRCRTIKLGGLSPDIVYSWFRCNISERGERLYFKKESGTQRLEGYLYPHEAGGYVLLAGLSAKGEPPHIYSGNGPTAGAPTTPDDAIGLLVSTGPGSARVELPYPGAESAFDVIELKR